MCVLCYKNTQNFLTDIININQCWKWTTTEYTEKFVYFNSVNYASTSYRLEVWIGLYKKDLQKRKMPPDYGKGTGSLLCKSALKQKEENSK